MTTGCVTERMSQNAIRLLQAGCILALGLFFGTLHLLYTGISEDFGTGLMVGILIGGGLIFLASRQARDS